MSKKTKFLGSILLVFCFLSCSKPNESNNVKVTTYASTDITSNGASFGGDVIVNGGGTPSELGVCWGTSFNPTVADAKMSTIMWNQPYV